MKDENVEIEEVRLATLRGYNILDTAPENDFDEITQLASELCQTPIALISLVEDDRQWFKSTVGTDMAQTDIESSICAHAVRARADLEIADTRLDPRTADNPLVTGQDNLQFYAGALLEMEDGLPMGTLCVLDHTPRRLSDFQRRALKVLANQVMRQIELRRALSAADILRKEVDHRVKNSLQSLEALIRIQARGETSEDARNALEAVQGRLSMISNLHEALYLADTGARVSMSSFLDRVVQAATQQLPEGVKVACNTSPLDLDPRDASSVGMIVNEAMANAGKYAFGDGGSGLFEVTGRRTDASYTLICRDDGHAASGAAVTTGTGMGQRIMQAAAQQLGGTCESGATDNGYTVTITWPMAVQG